ncbi:glycoside hydrolase family 114 protein [Lasiosphaeria ovina]|uniref:alpha-galactosidase n=1 Tax=Lasiosphaeria ovina TaxID=92902 RepID=A0AAE0NFI5_9PEZI|nr:glycoside hydrolase family 114 protein [Lasiosphaeria ovina]
MAFETKRLVWIAALLGALFPRAEADCLAPNKTQTISVLPNFTPGVKWQIEIQHTIDVTKPLVPKDALVWDIDLYHVQRHPEIISYLRSNIKDVVILCYVNAGLAQTSDCDFETVWQSPAYKGLLGGTYPDQNYQGEFWVDIRNRTARDLIKERITLAQRLGCDGVDPDNIDAFEQKVNGQDVTGWNLTAADYVPFVHELAAHAHSLTTARGHTLLIGQKNAPTILASISAALDFAVLEDCADAAHAPHSRPFCAAFAGAYARAGKPVFSIAYTPSLGGSDTSAVWGKGRCLAAGASAAEFAAEAEAEAGDAWLGKLSSVLKLLGGDVELNGCTQYCGEGPGRDVVDTAVNGQLDMDVCKPVEGM